jgi:hypothetical protein
MFLRAKSRLKDGKVHRYWSIVENRRTRGNRIVQRQVLYLGEINDNQQAAWCKTSEVFQEGQAQPQEMAIFPEDRRAPALDCEIVSIKLELRCSCTVPGNGAPAGWPVDCGINCGWMNFGRTNYPSVARGRGG